MQKAILSIVIVANDLTNNVQPLDITANKPTQSFISNNYHTWFSE